MEDLYPAGPNAIPSDLTKPTATYRNRAWMAMGGLGAFVALYFALTGWFGWTAYRLLRGAMEGGNDVLLGLIGGACAAFLTVFMAKAIFFVKHTYQIDDIEITAQQQPRLFAFLYRLADEAGAPRPHRVFLSPRVNAAVFYDLSILNLILPSKKNLEIGLGLVNVLGLGEFKAVLAHEFGHFAQRSMAVGRWVYIAQQIAGHIIAKRDALDAFLKGISRIDIRIAWVGWLLSLIVWSIRSVMETVFRVVVLAQRALSREMEFQADLVAVSLTGSDAIVNALHRLSVADTAWDRATQFSFSEAQEGRLVIDVFAVQSLVIDRLRAVWNNPSFREVPPPPTDRPQAHRIFQNDLAQPPRMWSTHPANAEREENAKRTYIGAAIDPRSAWDLFDQAQTVKEQMSAHIVREVTQKKPAAAVPLNDSLGKLSEQYNRAYLQPAYRGAYLGRSLTRHVKEAASLYETPPARDRIAAELAQMYPESLTAELDKLRQQESEKAALQALYEGFLTAPGGIIRHGGKELRRRDLPQVIEQLTAELNATQEIVHAHDRRCRSVHLAAAATLGNGWDAYLQGLANLLHYADHTEANLCDAQGVMHNVYAIVTADGRVSSGELDRLIGACSELYRALRSVYDASGEVALDRTVARRLSVENWQVSLEKMELPPPTKENISQWLNVIDGWTNAAAGALAALRLAALEQLLLSEAQVAKFVRESMTPNAAPAASTVPGKYSILLRGSERERQKKLGLWDRFQTADGIAPTLARLAVAAGIIVAVVSIGGSVGSSSVIIYNGLARSVSVQIGPDTTTVNAFAKQAVQIDTADSYNVTAMTDGKIIETFDANAERGFTHYVYNIASASPLIEWTVVYGQAREQPERRLGAPNWTTTSADVVFEEPPKEISTKSGGGTRSVLSAFGDQGPRNILSLLDSDTDRQNVVAAHARWDDTGSRHALEWITIGARKDAALLSDRLREKPHDVLLLRIEQDNAAASELATICVNHRALAAAHTDNPGLRYIGARCIENEDEKAREFLAAYREAPKNGWLALAAGYTHAGDAKWSEALSALEQARTTVRPMAEFVAVDVARIRRLAEAAPNLTNLYSDADMLRFFESVEKGENLDRPELRSYYQLTSGKLEQAISDARDLRGTRERILRLVGASEGATHGQVEEALQLPDDQGIDEDSVWSAYALALRERADSSSLSAAIEKIGDSNNAAVLRFISAIQHGELDQANNHLIGVMPRMRGQAYSAATILLGQRCPAAWRETAKRLLFAPERPYFH